MKKILSMLFILLTAMSSIIAQNDEDYGALWNEIMDNRFMFKIVAYGDFLNGKEKNRYYLERNEKEGMVFTPDKLFHIGSKEGDISYNVKIDGLYLRLTNKNIYTSDNKSIIDNQHSSWIKLESVTEAEDGILVLLIVDSSGIYRYLMFVGVASV